MCESAIEQAPRRREVWRSDNRFARLTYYPPGAAMASHAHETDQFSILLLGGFRETSSRDEADLRGYCAGFKAAGAVHENRFGPDGALILSVDAPACPHAGASWRWRRLAGDFQAAPIVRTLIDGDIGDETGDLIEDLIVAVKHPRNDESRRPAPAGWLRRVREQIDDAPEAAGLGALAAVAGVHYAHLSRAFGQAYGAPLSLYRRRVMAMRAASAIVAGASRPASAATDAGFSDQAHLTRVMRAELGLTPRRLARLFA